MPFDHLPRRFDILPAGGFDIQLGLILEEHRRKRVSPLEPADDQPDVLGDPGAGEMPRTEGEAVNGQDTHRTVRPEHPGHQGYQLQRGGEDRHPDGLRQLSLKHREEAAGGGDRQHPDDD